MGCCVRPKEKIAIKYSNIPLCNLKSVENQNRNNFRKNPNILDTLPNTEKKRNSNKTSDLRIKKEKVKNKKKIMKSMNALKKISYDEVYESPKYF